MRIEDRVEEVDEAANLIHEEGKEATGLLLADEAHANDIFTGGSLLGRRCRLNRGDGVSTAIASRAEAARAKERRKRFGRGPERNELVKLVRRRRGSHCVGGGRLLRGTGAAVRVDRRW